MACSSSRLYLGCCLACRVVILEFESLISIGKDRPIFPGPVRDMSGFLGFRRAGRATMDVWRGMVRQRDSERAAEMRWCWVWQHFSLNVLECNAMEKNWTILQSKDANSLSLCLKWHLIIADVIPHKHPPPISRVGVRQCPRIETSPPKHAPERTESRTPATLAQKT